MNITHWKKLTEADWKAVFLLSNVFTNTITMGSKSRILLLFTIGSKSKIYTLYMGNVINDDYMLAVMQNGIIKLQAMSKIQVITLLNNKAKELLRDPKYDLKESP